MTGCIGIDPGWRLVFKAQQWFMEGEEAERWKACGGLAGAETEDVELTEEEEDPSVLSPVPLKYSIGGGLAAMAVILKV